MENQDWQHKGILLNEYCIRNNVSDWCRYKRYVYNTHSINFMIFFCFERCGRTRKLEIFCSIKTAFSVWRTVFIIYVRQKIQTRFLAAPLRNGFFHIYTTYIHWKSFSVILHIMWELNRYKRFIRLTRRVKNNVWKVCTTKHHFWHR